MQKIGYHYLIPRDGWTEVGRMESEDGAHVLGFNKKALGVCLVGGLNANAEPDPSYSKEQWISLAILVRGLNLRYPSAKVWGHRDFPGVTKACPCFDVKDWWARINS